MKISTWINTGLVLTTALSSVVAAHADGLEKLKKYEDRYQIVKGNSPQCPRHVDVVHNQVKNYLALNRPDDIRSQRRDWSWMRFTHLNEGKQLQEAFFAISTYAKSVAKQTKDGWKIEKLRKECRMRLLCGRWRSTHWVVLTDQMLEIGSHSVEKQCIYGRPLAGTVSFATGAR